VQFSIFASRKIESAMCRIAFIVPYPSAQPIHAPLPRWFCVKAPNPERFVGKFASAEMNAAFLDCRHRLNRHAHAWKVDSILSMQPLVQSLNNAEVCGACSLRKGAKLSTDLNAH
jgi:hypothetical protein